MMEQCFQNYVSLCQPIFNGAVLYKETHILKEKQAATPSAAAWAPAKSQAGILCSAKMRGHPVYFNLKHSAYHLTPLTLMLS